MLKLKENVVRQKIAETGYSVKAWGELHGFSQTTLSNWITGVRNIKRNNLENLASALGCEPFDIASVVIEYTGKGISELEADREEICGIFGYLDDKQRKTILRLADMLASSNRKIQELKDRIE